MQNLPEPPSPSSLSCDTVDFWSGRYQRCETPWDLGQVAPPFVETADALKAQIGPGAKVCVVGCGRGHEAAFFAEAGFTVTGLDFSPLAVAEATRLYGHQVQFVEADLFNLPKSLHHQFDAVIEHTCFCAILPSRRPDYVRAIETLLKPGGTFLGLFFCHTEPDGPPYGSTEAELETLFCPPFTWESAHTPTNSTEARAGDERLVWMRLLHDASQPPT